MLTLPKRTKILAIAAVAVVMGAVGHHYLSRSSAISATCEWARLLPFPPPALLALADAALGVEQDRWASLLADRPVPAVREAAAPLFPVVPENPPVY